MYDCFELFLNKPVMMVQGPNNASNSWQPNDGKSELYPYQTVLPMSDH